MSADLSLAGHSVTLVKSSDSTIHSGAFECLQGEGKPILVKENGNLTEVKLSNCTTDLSTISKADIVIVTVQTQYHEELLRRMRYLVSKQQILVLVPGYMGGFYVKNIMGIDAPTIVEMTGPPVEGRVDHNDKCIFRVGSRLKLNTVSVIPAKGTSKPVIGYALQSLGYPIDTSYNPIEAGLLNPNLILHTAGSILSIPRIENAKDKFCMYHEAYTKDNVGMMRIVEALNNEKNQVLNTLGFESVSFLQSADFWDDTAMDKFLDYAASDNRANAPTSITDRYITEDVSQGLVLLESVAELVDVDTPITTSLINIASAAIGRDFRKDGRTVERLGAKEYILKLCKQA